MRRFLEFIMSKKYKKPKKHLICCLLIRRKYISKETTKKGGIHLKWKEIKNFEITFNTFYVFLHLLEQKTIDSFFFFFYKKINKNVNKHIYGKLF
jgi:hypothetical protein